MGNLTDATWLLATWQLQVALGSGYAAYMISYTGIRHHHQAVDTTFKTIAFGLVATAVLLGMPTQGKVAAIATAFSVTVATGIAWRTLGMSLWQRSLRFLDISWADDTPSAWAKMSAEQGYFITQVSVMLEDGTRLRCNDASTCGALPLGPCVLGTSGDILLYVTHVKKPSGVEIECVAMNDPHYGARLTYLPASSVKQLDIRRKPIPRRSPMNRARDWINRRRLAAKPDDSR